MSTDFKAVEQAIFQKRIRCERGWLVTEDGEPITLFIPGMVDHIVKIWNDNLGAPAQQGVTISTSGQEQTRNSECLASFSDFCRANPGLRFWQALRAWCGYHYVLVADADNRVFPTSWTNVRDTFSWEGRDTAAPAPPVSEGLKEAEQWRCFHCGYVATDRQQAEAHFGDRDDAQEFTPICKWWTLASEDERVATLQQNYRELNGERDENIRLLRELEAAQAKLTALPSPEQGWVKEAAEIVFRKDGLTGDWRCWCEACCLLRRVLASQPRTFDNISDKEPNGYPLWFNRAVQACEDCDSEDLCRKHLEIAERDFAGCESEIEAFTNSLPAPIQSPKQGWVKVSERLPEPGGDVLLWLDDLDDQDIIDFVPRKGLAVGHLDADARGEIITRPLTGPDETKEQWPAWDIGESNNYHRASHWQPIAITAPPRPSTEEGK